MAKLTKTENSKKAKMKSISLQNVKINDSLIKQKGDINRKKSLSHQYKMCEKTGKIDNFRIAAGRKNGKIKGRAAADSDDVYKWLEGCCFSLTNDQNDKVKEIVDNVVKLIAEAQDDNGYLNTSFLFNNQSHESLDPGFKEVNH